MPAHRYVFTVHALAVAKLELPANATSAVVRFFICQNTIATASLTGLQRPSHPGAIVERRRG